MSASPYCEVDGCHDARTNRYAVQVGPTTWSGYRPSDTRTIYVNYPWGQRLCRIHAMQLNRLAYGGAA